MASSPSRSKRSTDLSSDLLVRGGTIVTADESFVGDVVVKDGRIESVIRADGMALAPRAAALSDAASSGSAAAAREIDATGLLVLPGIVDVHTHTRVPSDELPDRFFEDSVGAAFGGTTTFLTFNNPGTGISKAGQRTLRAGIAEFHAASEGESAVDFGLSGVITAQHDRPEVDIVAAIEGGVATFKVFFVYDFGVDAERLRQLLEVTDAAGGMLEVHGEDREMLDAGIAAQIEAGRTQPRYHADSRPPAVEARGTRVAIEVAREVGTPVYFVHVSSAAAVNEIAAARGKGQPVFAETCPQYLVLDESCYETPDAQCTRYVISPPLRPKSDQDALWTALQQGQLDLIATDSVPDRLADEKQWTGQSFDQISNGSPGIETLLAMVYGKGVATGRLSIEKAVDLLATTPARLFGLQAKGAIEAGKDADLVLFDPEARRTIRATDHHHSADFTLFEGMEVEGVVRRTIVRGEDVVREGEFVGHRGFGRYQSRSLA